MPIEIKRFGTKHRPIVARLLTVAEQVKRNTKLSPNADRRIRARLGLLATRSNQLIERVS